MMYREMVSLWVTTAITILVGVAVYMALYVAAVPDKTAYPIAVAVCVPLLVIFEYRRLKMFPLPYRESSLKAKNKPRR